MSAPQLCENDRGEWKLFIKNLPWSADDDMVWTEFGAAGEVCYARVCTEQETGRSRGFGFVCYKTKAEAQKAIDMLNGKNLDGRDIVVRAAEDRRNMAAKPAGGAAGSYSKSKGVCYAFQRGECTRGDSCKFAHEGGEAAAPAVHEEKSANKKITFGDGDDQDEEEEKVVENKDLDKETGETGVKRKAETAPADEEPSKKKSKSDKWIKYAKKALKKADGKSLKIKELLAKLADKGIDMDKKALKKALKGEALFALDKKVVTLA